MYFQKTKIKGLFIIKPNIISDSRGYFERLFCKKEFKKKGLEKNICQINHTLTKIKGTIRGMHYQISPEEEDKIVTCIKGKIFDVAIDIRKKSKTFLDWQGFILDSKNRKMIYIPKGFAHGFQTLSNNCELLYFHTAYYNKNTERTIKYNDSKINIKWKIEVKNISKKDSTVSLLKQDFSGI